MINIMYKDKKSFILLKILILINIFKVTIKNDSLIYRVNIKKIWKNIRITSFVLFKKQKKMQVYIASLINSGHCK